jgi:sugar phosphate isomerase/epimerase
MHPRISVHEVTFPTHMDLADVLDWTATHDIAQVGLFSLRHPGGWADAIARVAASRTSVAYICQASMFVLEDPASWNASRVAINATLDAAAEMSCGIVYATTGPIGTLDFDAGVAALASAVAPVLAHAADRGVRLLTETAGPVFHFTHFLHTFQDTIDACAETGLGLVLDLHPTWHERDIRAKIAAVAPHIGLVQVSDYIPRNMTANRDIVGEGVIPIESLLGTLFEAGYDRAVDLELYGRPSDTALDDILRSAERLTVILDRLGV